MRLHFKPLGNFGFFYVFEAGPCFRSGLNRRCAHIHVDPKYIRSISLSCSAQGLLSTRATPDIGTDKCGMRRGRALNRTAKPILSKISSEDLSLPFRCVFRNILLRFLVCPLSCTPARQKPKSLVSFPPSRASFTPRLVPHEVLRMRYQRIRKRQESWRWYSSTASRETHRDEDQSIMSP